MWDNVKKLVAFWEGLSKSKQPSSKSYLAVKDSVGDPLFIAKIQFLSFPVKYLRAIPEKIPNWSMMIPFLYCDWKMILYITVNYKIIVIKKYKNGKQLMEIDLAKEENLLSVNKIKMGYSVEDTLNKLK